MVWPFVVGGIVLLIGFACWYFINQKKKALYTVQFVPKSSVENVVRSAITDGFQVAKVEGDITCEEPLISELAEKECVYYRMEVTEHYREKRTSTDSKGNSTTNWVSSTREVSSNTRQVDFYVDDGSGRIKVSLENADYETEKVLNRYEPYSSGGGISFGSFKFDLGDLMGAIGIGNYQIEGYTYEESIIPVGKKCLVAGGINKKEEAFFTSPTDPRYAYLLSFKDETGLTADLKSDLFWLKISRVVFLVAGLALILYGLKERGILPMNF